MIKIILVGVALCALVGCGQKECCQEGAISGMIRDLPIRHVADFSGVYDSVTQICDRIESRQTRRIKAAIIRHWRRAWQTLISLVLMVMTERCFLAIIGVRLL